MPIFAPRKDEIISLFYKSLAFKLGMEGGIVRGWLMKPSKIAP